MLLKEADSRGFRRTALPEVFLNHIFCRIPSEEGRPCIGLFRACSPRMSFSNCSGHIVSFSLRRTLYHIPGGSVLLSNKPNEGEKGDGETVIAANQDLNRLVTNERFTKKVSSYSNRATISGQHRLKSE